MRSLDFSSWQALLSTLLGLLLITLIGVGIRLLLMQTVQQRRERDNRQINERLRILIAAYKTLGGSFTGVLAVDPTHLRDLRAQANEDQGNERARRIRDAVEGALSDVILLGTEEQVRLAAHAANELAAGRQVEVAELVVSLRTFIRRVLALEPVPAAVVVPRQGPTRVTPTGGKGKGETAGGAGGGKGGGSGGGMGGALGGGMMGLGAGAAITEHGEEPDHGHEP